MLCGDFNLCPQPLDSWNEAKLAGRIFHTDDERSRFERLLTTGLVDVFRQEHPDQQAFSWWDYRGGAFHRGQGLRIDFLLASPDANARVKSTPTPKGQFASRIGRARAAPQSFRRLTRVSQP